MPIELTCLIMLISNAILLALIIILVKKFKVNKLRNYIKQLETEKLEDHQEILQLQYEISLATEQRQTTNHMSARFKVINMN